MANSVTYIINLRDKATKKLTRMQKTTSRVDKTFGKLQSRLLAFAGTAAIARGISNATKKLMEFEKTASNLSAITGAVGKDLDFLKRKAIEMGKATTKSSVETLEAFKLIASAKPELLTNASALAAVTKEAIALSEASGLDLPEAATALADTLNQFGLAADQSSRIINVLAAGSKFAAAEIPDLSTSLKEFGGVADSLGIPVEQAAASVETLSTKGLKGARAGIQLRNVLLKMGSGAKKTNPKIVGLSTALQNLAPIQDDVTALTKMFGRQNVIAAQTLIKGRKRMDELTTAMTGTNIAYEQQAINVDNLSGSVDRMSSAWEGFILNLNKGEGAITKFVRKSVDGITKIISALDRLNMSMDEIAAEGAEKFMARFARTIKEDSTEDAIKTAILDEAGRLQSMADLSIARIVELGGFDKAERAVKRLSQPVRHGATRLGKDLLGIDQQKIDQKRQSELEYYKSLTESIEQLKTLIRDPLAYTKFASQFASVIPGIDPVNGEVDVTGDAAKQITTITGAAPKTFNINIDSLIESFSINTENITESSEAVKRQITLAMAEALADVQPVTD